MTDDKAIEAALDAWFENDDWKQPGFPEPDSLRNDMRAAIAAADEARAEGFDFAGQSRAVVNTIGDFDDKIDVTEDALRAAFAAGLAKGEAVRAALVEALEDVSENGMLAIHTAHWDSSGMHEANCPVCIQQREVSARVRAALALVRKGV